jgi:hypothetical protein
VSKKSRTMRLASLLFMLAMIAALAGVELVVSAQDTMSGTAAQNDNAAATTPAKGRRRRRGRKPKAAADATATSSDTAAAATPAATPKPRRGGCDRDAQEQTDLSGTYTGTVNYPDGGATGAATLTITGNQLTLEAGGTNLSGKISAETTCHYTGATIAFAGTPSTSVSVRAKKVGKGLTLTSVAGETHKFSFVSGRAPRGRRAKPAAAAEAAPATTSDASASAGADAATTPKPRRGRRRRAPKAAATTNANANM